MPPKAPTADAPADLLWRENLQRANAHLLRRLDSQDASIKKLDASVKATEAAINEKIVVLSQQISDKNQDLHSDDLQKLKKTVKDKFDEIFAQIKGITTQTSQMEEREEDAKKQRKDAARSEQLLFSRIEDLEESLGEYGRQLKGMGKKVDEETVELIRDQLKRIQEDVKQHRTNATELEKRLGVLQGANEELKKGCKALADGMKQLAARPVPTGIPPSLQFAGPANHPPMTGMTRVTEVMEPRAFKQIPQSKGKEAVRCRAGELEAANPFFRNLEPSSSDAPNAEDERAVIRHNGLSAQFEMGSGDENDDLAIQLPASPSRRRGGARKCKPMQSIEEVADTHESSRRTDEPKKSAMQIKQETAEAIQAAQVSARVRKAHVQAKRPGRKVARPEVFDTDARFTRAQATATAGSSKQMLPPAPRTRNARAVKMEAAADLQAVQVPVSANQEQSQGPEELTKRGRPQRAAKKRMPTGSYSQVPARQIKKEPEQTQAASRQVKKQEPKQLQAPPRGTKRKPEPEVEPLQATRAPAVKKRKAIVKQEPELVSETTASSIVAGPSRPRAQRRTAAPLDMSSSRLSEAETEIDWPEMPPTDALLEQEEEEADLPELPETAFVTYEDGRRDLKQNSDDSVNNAALAQYA